MCNELHTASEIFSYWGQWSLINLLDGGKIRANSKRKWVFAWADFAASHVLLGHGGMLSKKFDEKQTLEKFWVNAHIVYSSEGNKICVPNSVSIVDD